METLKTRLIVHSELTFITLARTSDVELATSDIPNLSMIGDVNIFFNGAPGDQDLESEAEIMIAGELTLRGIDIPPQSAPLPPRATSKLTKLCTISLATQNQGGAGKASRTAPCN